MECSHSFAPNAARAAAIDKKVRASLADSLEHSGTVAEKRIAFDVAAWALLISNMRNGTRFAPSMFVRYYELVFAIIEGRYPDAQALIAAMLQEQPLQPSHPQLCTFTDPTIAPHVDRYLELLNSDSGSEFIFLSPPPDMVASFEKRFQRSWALMEKALPELAGEVRSLVSQIIVVTGDENSRLQFDGGSFFKAWGALFINAAMQTNELKLIETLAHESAHTLLFGFCDKEPLVANADEELFPSPLRIDLRPMDGIYHATFVSARMHWAVTELMHSGMLSDEEMTLAQSMTSESHEHFWAGYATVQAHAKLTSTGRQLMDHAHAYMRNATALPPLSTTMPC